MKKEPPVHVNNAHVEIVKKFVTFFRAFYFEFLFLVDVEGQTLRRDVHKQPDWNAIKTQINETSLLSVSGGFCLFLFFPRFLGEILNKKKQAKKFAPCVKTLCLKLELHFPGERINMLKPTSDIIRLENCLSIIVEGLMSKVDLPVFAAVTENILRVEGGVEHPMNKLFHRLNMTCSYAKKTISLSKAISEENQFFLISTQV